MEMSRTVKGLYAFGAFRLDPSRRILLHEGARVKLPPRLFDTLLHLVEHAGHVVERADLIRAVWGSRIVEEATVNQTIFALRKALGCGGGTDRLIITAPTRGYRFAAQVAFEADPDVATTIRARSEEGPYRNPPAGLRAKAWPRSLAVPAGLALMAAILIGLTWLLPPASGGPAAVAALAFDPPPRSVAVMPFANLSGDPAQDYVSDGLTEELINALSRIDTLRVVARMSAFSFKGKAAPLADIARALHVGTVLEGTVRRDRGRIRVTADLVSTATGFALWSARYDRDAANMLDLQGTIAQSVASSLRIRLMRSDEARLAPGGTANPHALDAYLRGMALLRRSQAPVDQAAGAAKAVAAFDEAIAIDPGFAAARAERAASLITMAAAGTPHATQALNDAKAEAERAIAIAPDLASAHLSRGYALREALDFADGDREVALARDLAPDDADTELSYAEMLLNEGHAADAIAAATLGASLDPLRPSAYYTLASRLAYAGRNAEALTAYGHGEALDHTGEPTSKGMMLYALGQYGAARQACAGQTVWVGALCLALSEHKLGLWKDALSQRDRLKTMLGGTAPFALAELYSEWGDAAESLRALKAAYDVRDPGLTYLKSDPLLNAIRHAPEFAAIERRLSFPP